MARPSLRWMVMIPILATIALGFASFAVYIDRVEKSNRIADIDEELVRAGQSAAIRRPAAPNGPPAEPDPGARPVDGALTGATDDEVDTDPPVQLTVSPDGTVLDEGGAQNPFSETALRQLIGSDGFTTASAENYRVLVSDGRGDTLSITALSLDGFDEAVQAFRRALFAGGIVIMALVAAVVWQVTTVLIRPVTEMTATATSIAEGDLDIDIVAPGGSREMANLATDLDSMLTTLRSTLAQRERSAAEATKARDDMQRFLADISHELRTPLTALKGYSDLYQKGMLLGPEDVDRAMARIGSESERLSMMAGDMLELARGASMSDAFEPFDLRTAAAVVVDDLRAAHPDHDIEFDGGAHAGPVMIDGVPGRFHQALLNLGSNACNHSDPADPIHVTVSVTADDCDRSDGEASIAVVDHGPGVSEEEAARIFLPFYRAETSRSRAGDGGAGLGLALTQQIAEQHGGSVSVKPTDGGGATFVLRLPMTAA